jgi:hypothetical protein
MLNMVHTFTKGPGVNVYLNKCEEKKYSRDFLFVSIERSVTVEKPRAVAGANRVVNLS